MYLSNGIKKKLTRMLTNLSFEEAKEMVLWLDEGYDGEIPILRYLVEIIQRTH